jgi:hypothetical protein
MALCNADKKQVAEICKAMSPAAAPAHKCKCSPSASPSDIKELKKQIASLKADVESLQELASQAE